MNDPMQPQPDLMKPAPDAAQSDTPRTDGAVIRGSVPWVQPSFARQLERELEAAETALRALDPEELERSRRTDAIIDRRIERGEL